jgi:hypothetical protein
MPRYLRWIAAMTSGVTAFFIYNMISLGIARASGVHTIHGSAGGLLALGAWVFAMGAVLATEDYLTKRYGFEVVRRSAERSAERPAPDAVSAPVSTDQ